MFQLLVSLSYLRSLMPCCSAVCAVVSLDMLILLLSTSFLARHSVSSSTSSLPATNVLLLARICNVRCFDSLPLILIRRTRRCSRLRRPRTRPTNAPFVTGRFELLEEHCGNVDCHDTSEAQSYIAEYCRTNCGRPQSGIVLEELLETLKSEAVSPSKGMSFSRFDALVIDMKVS
jgi:hypothetical protein